MYHTNISHKSLHKRETAAQNNRNFHKNLNILLFKNRDGRGK